jgi:hypothetical protein
MPRGSGRRLRRSAFCAGKQVAARRGLIYSPRSRSGCSELTSWQISTADGSIRSMGTVPIGSTICRPTRSVFAKPHGWRRLGQEAGDMNAVPLELDSN